jgi:hypothetical protein
MKVISTANFISQRVVDSKKDVTKKYIYIKFDDGSDILEVQADRVVEVPRFANCEIVLDIIQNQYGIRLNLIDCKVVK